jgi:hypothetical protein
LFTVLTAWSASAQEALSLSERVEPYQVFQARIVNQSDAVANLDKIVKATILVNWRSNCSGVFVSNDGYLLTALHCLQDAETTENIALFSSKNTGEGGLIVGTSPSTYLKNITIRTQALWPDIANKNIEASAQVILMGRGFAYRFPEANSSLVAKNKFREELEDFAILKFDSLPSGVHCVPLSTENSANGEEIWHSGFPQHVQTPYLRFLKNKQKAELERADNEQGTRWVFDAFAPLYISTGHVYNNYNDILTSRPRIAGDAAVIDAISDQKMYLASSAASMGGFSGGGAFDLKGNLIGINAMRGFTNGVKYDAAGNPDKDKIAKATDFSYGTSIIKADHIYKRAQQTLGEQSAANIFNCDMK